MTEKDQEKRIEAAAKRISLAFGYNSKNRGKYSHAQNVARMVLEEADRVVPVEPVKEK